MAIKIPTTGAIRHGADTAIPTRKPKHRFEVRQRDFAKRATEIEKAREAYQPRDAKQWRIAKRLQGLRIEGRYIDYLVSPEWLFRRQKLFKQRGKRCEACGTTRRVEIHHLTYAAIGHELDEHLVILCRDCHQKRHTGKRGFESHATEPHAPAGRASRIARERGSEILRPPQEPSGK